MNIYAIQVKTGSEEAFIKRFHNTHVSFDNYIFHFPQRCLTERKSGKINKVNKPVFDGYVFVQTDGVDLYLFRQTQGFIRFLPAKTCGIPLQGKDLVIVSHFIKNKGVSKVRFDENNRIVVLEGVLAGLEGNIVKVDKRKGRAKIKLDLYDDSFTIDLAFEVIGAA